MREKQTKYTCRSLYYEIQGPGFNSRHLHQPSPRLRLAGQRRLRLAGQRRLRLAGQRRLPAEAPKERRRATKIQQYNNTTIQRYNQVQHKMFFVYHLQSVEHPEEKYTGYTTDISKRLESHNNAQVPHTANHKPWKLINYFAFDTVDKARKFEHYLKSGSGRAFAQKHFQSKNNTQFFITDQVAKVFVLTDDAISFSSP